MKKKILCFSLVLACCLTACGGESTGSGGQSTESGAGQEDMVQQPESGGNSEVQESVPDNTESAFGDASMEELKKAVVEALGEENYWPNMSADEEILSEMYGISEDMYDDFFVEMPMISTNVDTMIIIKAKTGQEAAVEAALNDYRDKMVNDSFQYPMNMGKVQASRIEAFGNYVCFIQLGGEVTDLLDQGDDVVIAHCQEQNEKALEAIRIALAD